MDNLKLAALNCLVSGVTGNRFVLREKSPGGDVYLDLTEARKALARGQGAPARPARPSQVATPPKTHLLPPPVSQPLPSGSKVP